MSYRLVPATLEDRAWLEDLRRAVYRELFFATWGAWDEARHQRHTRDCWEQGGIFLIEIEHVRVGMIQVHDRPNTVEIGEIQVRPPEQGRGIGTHVLSDVIARSHSRRKSVSLSDGLRNERARRLYERLGFREVAQSDTHRDMVCIPTVDLLRG
ncbi:MAG: GNAT family N-acetyltransferase [Steroidobacteraceae bacterium]